jgi:hypothetical protein
MEKMRNVSDGRTFLSEYYGDGNKRSAQIYHAWQGYSVDFLVDGNVVESRSLWEYSRRYAEDVAENWVEEII